MFGAKVINYINEVIPELHELDIQIDGNTFNIGSYELLNALLIHNNLLNEKNNNIAIFHPKSDLVDVFNLIVMGIAAYKDSIIRNSKLKLKDFEQGELVEYNGKIVRYDGIKINPKDKSKSFQISYREESIKRPNGSIVSEYIPSKTTPIEYFSDISKYTGSKIVPDLVGAKNDKKMQVTHTLQRLIGFQEKHGLSGYPSYLISSERSILTDLLKVTTINGTHFFDIFPSVRCTPENRYRLGRDTQQRAYMFYFVANISTADDILNKEPHIKTLFIDAQGKTLSNASTLASIRNRYELKDIFWLQTYVKIDTIDTLEKGLGFNVWIWDSKDFKEFSSDIFSTNTLNKINESLFGSIILEHNQISYRLANYSDISVEIPYPEQFTMEQHKQIQHQIHLLFSISTEYENNELLRISILIASLINKIFQTPLPINIVDNKYIELDKNSVRDQINFIRSQITLLSNGSIPSEFIKTSLELLTNVESFVKIFSDYNIKAKEIITIIKKYPNKKICVITNPKYSMLNDPLLEKLTYLLNLHDNTNLLKNIVFTNSLTQAAKGHDINIWTYKPQIQNLLMLEEGVEKNYILLYPLQKNEFDRSINYNLRIYQKYLNPAYRANILNVSTDLLNVDKSIPTIPLTIDVKEDFDLEKLLSSTIANALSTYDYTGYSDMVDSRMVYFTDGTHALFQKGYKIKVLNEEQQTIDTKTVNELTENDQVIFLKDSKRTLFDDVLEYYENNPEILELVKLSELWRTALIKYKEKRSCHPIIIKKELDKVGLIRSVGKIESWLDGTTICPDEDNYAPIDKIALITNDIDLNSNLDKVKDAARKIHSLRIKIGRYLAKKITQAYVSADNFDDPILKDKLDEISNHVHVAQITMINEDISKVPNYMTNKLLTEEDIYNG